MALSAKLLLIALLLSFRPGSTPEATVTEFVKAWNARNVSKAATMVTKGKPGADFSAVLNSFPQGSRITLGKMTSSLRGDLARVYVKVKFTVPNLKPVEKQETVMLTRMGSDWKIMPAAGSTNGETILTLATATANGQPLALAADGGARSECLSNVKALGTAMMFYLVDHDDMFDFNPAKVQSVLFKYTKSNSIWACPGSKASSAYSFNANLANRSINEANDPSKTVMLYEGSKGKLKFSHQGYAAVVFLDGSARFVKPENAGMLKWKL